MDRVTAHWREEVEHKLLLGHLHSIPDSSHMLIRAICPYAAYFNHGPSISIQVLIVPALLLLHW
jgi:hypothetical protein